MLRVGIVDRWLDLIGALKEPFDLNPFAHDETLPVALDQRGAAEEQAFFSAGNAEIVDGTFV
jgi:hypothetical protein